MKPLTLLLTLLLALPLSAHADEASKRAKAQEMFTILHMDRLMSQMTNNVLKQTSSMTEQLTAQDTTPEMKAKRADFQSQVLKLVDAQIGWKAIEPQYTDLYAQTYTEEELDAILAFYKSPAGTSMLAKSPELSAKSMQMVQSRLATIQPQLMKMIQDFAHSNAPSAPAQPAHSPSK
jgi:hypothetical protein